MAIIKCLFISSLFPFSSFSPWQLAKATAIGALLFVQNDSYVFCVTILYALLLISLPFHVMAFTFSFTFDSFRNWLVHWARADFCSSALHVELSEATLEEM